MSVRKTKEQFCAEIDKLYNGEYSVLGEYVNGEKPILVRHNKCGNTYYISPRYLLRHQGLCKANGCNIDKGTLKREKHQKRQEKIFSDYVCNNSKGEYLVIGDYINSTTSISIQHKTCGKVFKITPKRFHEGGRCPNKECVALRKHHANPRTKTPDEFLREVNNLTDGEYSVLSNYYNWKTKVKLRHNLCGNIFMMEPNSFLSGRRCPTCQHKLELQKRSKTDTQFKKELLEKFLGEYTCLDTYISQAHYVTIKHNKCGKTWKCKPNNILSGLGCPFCNQSHGETYVSNYLVNKNIPFKEQVKFNKLKDKQRLSYDFMIKDKKVLIEYQGIQHYKPSQFFGGVKKFSTQQKHDRMKRQFAVSIGYTLIEIPYTENSYNKVELFLDKHLLNS